VINTAEADAAGLGRHREWLLWGVSRGKPG